MTLVAVDGSQYPSLVFQNVDQFAIISNFYTFLFSNKTRTPVLLETSLQLCVQTLNVTVLDGQTYSSEINRYTDVVENMGHQVLVKNDTSVYLMRDNSFGGLRSFITNLFNGSYIVHSDGSIAYSSDAIEVLVDALLVPPYDQAAMALFLNGFATSVTNA